MTTPTGSDGFKWGLDKHMEKHTYGKMVYQQNWTSMSSSSTPFLFLVYSGWAGFLVILSGKERIIFTHTHSLSLPSVMVLQSSIVFLTPTIKARVGNERSPHLTCQDYRQTCIAFQSCNGKNTHKLLALGKLLVGRADSQGYTCSIPF